jgi:hypothetical protein
MLEMFRTLPQIALPPIIEEVCTSLTEKRQHLVKLDKNKLGLSCDLHLLFLPIMHTEAVFWPFFQFAMGNTMLLLPWDPGLPLLVMETMVSTFIYGFAIRLRTSSDLTSLQGNSIRELFSYSFVVGMIKEWMVKY